MFSQYAQTLNIDPPDDIIERIEKLYFVHQTVDVFIERHLNTEECRKLIEEIYKPLTPGQSYLYSLKEKLIREDYAELRQTVCDTYRNLILHDFPDEDVEDYIGNFREIVETDFSYLDLYPGDTQIHYKIFTKRQLVRI